MTSTSPRTQRSSAMENLIRLKLLEVIGEVLKSSRDLNEDSTQTKLSLVLLKEFEIKKKPHPYPQELKTLSEICIEPSSGCLGPCEDLNDACLACRESAEGKATRMLAYLMEMGWITT